MQRLGRFSTRYLHTSAPVHAAQTKEVTIHRHDSIRKKQNKKNNTRHCRDMWVQLFCDGGCVSEVAPQGVKALAGFRV